MSCARLFAAALAPATALVICAATLAAQQSDTTRRRDPQRLPGVRVVEQPNRYADTLTESGSKVPVSILDIPQSVQTVSRQVIEDRQLATVREATRLVSGLAPGRSATNELVIRGINDNGATTGFGLGGSIFAVNGLKNYFAGYETDVPLINVERVEVLKGASGVLYGFNQPGGVVNLVTKQPLGTPRYRASASMGSWRRTRFDADFTGPVTGDGRLRYRLNAAYINSPDYRDVFFNRNVTVAPTLAYDASERTQVGLELLYSSTTRTAWYDWGVPARDASGSDIFQRVDRQYSPHQLGDLATLESRGAVVTVRHALRPGITLHSASSLGGNSTAIRGHVPSFAQALPNAEGNVGLRYRFFDGEYGGFFSTNYVAAELRRGVVSHRLVVGIDVLDGSSSGRETSASNSATIPNNVAPMNVFRPDFGVRQAANYVFNGGYTVGGTVGFVGAYVQDAISIGSRLDLLLGLRTDRYRTRDGIGAPEGTNRPVLPNTGVVFKPVASTSLYASYTSGFEPQVVTDPTAGGPFDPLTSWQIESGVKRLWLSGALTTTASVYRIERRNELVSANDSLNPDRLRQLGQTVSDGVEFDVAGSPLPNLSVSANYAYNFARPTRSDAPSSVDKRLPNAPAHMGGVWARVDVPGGPLRGLGLAAGVSGVSERFGAFERTTYEGYTLVDAALYYRFDDVSLSLNASNLTNERYLSGIWSNFYAQRGMPRSFILRVGFAY